MITGNDATLRPRGPLLVQQLLDPAQAAQRLGVASSLAHRERRLELGEHRSAPAVAGSLRSVCPT